MSPSPSRRSAPIASRMVRESMRDVTWNEMRAGKFALMRPGDDVDRRPLRREDQVDAGGARLLREARDRLLDLAPDRHHEVGELVDDDDDARQVAVHEAARRLVAALARSASPPPSSPSSRPRPPRAPPRAPLGLLRLREQPVVAVDVADALLVQEPVAVLHLLHHVGERAGGLLRVGHDRDEQVRDVLVDRELEHLRVDHDEAHVARRRLVEDAHDHRVHRHRLAGAGGAGDQEVRHRARSAT